MQNIEFSKSGNVVYHIDTEAKTVIAKLRCNENDPMTLFGSQVMEQTAGEGFGPVEMSAFPQFFDKFKIQNDYYGIAKCHPDDEFDIDFGKRLALLRAKQKYLDAVERVLDKSNKWIEQVANRIDRLCMSQYRKVIDNRIAESALLDTLEE